MLELEGAESSITPDDFLDVEKLAGGVLPLYFKALYLSANGGFPAATEVEGEECVFSINGFNSIKFGGLPIEKLMQDFYSQDEKLRGYVPFAYDDGGNSFMLSLKCESSGVVYLLLHEDLRLERVCKSFEVFLSSLLGS
ncbi:SMI1/KNR4 family protein [Pseudomonas monteilii]|uniref:SMI1/KNR4 family protein n=1 Tax=Pseudomonas alabamensis TaxID=3064349 RepID=UPI0027128DCD|nr:SMI1/KNR4 family protein [Pseudomonas sp. 22-AL-CL-001]MDO7909245.1 SMI1/KNR4 family protein [Pseudomonas sp. 22-AL-CL-001]